MLRKIGMTAAAVAIGFAGVAALASPASAGKPVLGAATGNVTCQITAKVKISPPLSDSVIAPNTTPSTTTAKTKSTSCTSSGGTIGTFMTGGKAKGLVTSTGTEPGTCTGLAAPGDTPFTAVVTWKPAGAKADPSNITFANVGATEALDGFLLPAAGEAGKGTSTVSGSFAGNDAWAFANLGGLPDVTKCFDTGTAPKIKKAKGLKKLTVVSGHITVTQ
jgi:hypothetical protein